MRALNFKRLNRTTLCELFICLNYYACIINDILTHLKMLKVFKCSKGKQIVKAAQRFRRRKSNEPC